MSPSSRALAAALVIAGFTVGGRSLHDRLWDADPSPVDLTVIPARIGEWTVRDPLAGEEAAQGPEDVLNRIQRAYSDASGHTLSVEVEIFPASGFVHPPEICYRGAGAAFIARQDLSLASGGGENAVGRLLTVYRGGRLLHVLYWYQLGPYVFCDWSGLCRAQWFLGGERRPRPLVKVMVQAPAAACAEADKRLRSFAGPFLAWTQTIR